MFRLIADPPRPAALNMAIDEILMRRQNLPGAQPALRFYSWSEPAYSVGYFQDVAEIARRFGTKNRKATLVRRLTGGGMVFHGNDLTFSLSLPNPNPFFKGDVKDSYLRVNEALRKGLVEIFPELDYADCKSVAPSGRASNARVCFESPSCYDLLLRGKKVVGASQRRIGGAILHQSTIFLDEKKEALIARIVKGFEKAWSVNFQKMPLSAEELSEAQQIVGERYTQAEWSALTA